jgi:hypothetical protein
MAPKLFLNRSLEWRDTDEIEPKVLSGERGEKEVTYLK